jgi:predicted nuclease of predicted toxin-antitoxin system
VKVIIDQQLPPALAAWLRNQGLDAAHVRDVNLSRAPDREILAWAERDQAVIVSRDEDFVHMIRESADARLVWVRLGNCANADLIAAVGKAWPEIASRLAAGERLVELRG